MAGRYRLLLPLPAGVAAAAALRRHARALVRSKLSHTSATLAGTAALGPPAGGETKPGVGPRKPRALCSAALAKGGGLGNDCGMDCTALAWNCNGYAVAVACEPRCGALEAVHSTLGPHMRATVVTRYSTRSSTQVPNVSAESIAGRAVRTPVSQRCGLAGEGAGGEY